LGVRPRLRLLARANVAWRVYPGSGHALDDPATGWIRRAFLDELASWISRSQPDRR
jgi:hypothetical protein